MYKVSITDVLDYGLESAKTCKELAYILGYSSTRRVSKEIECLRKKGEVILSCNTGDYRGYYKPLHIRELEHFRKSMYSRMKNIKLAVISTEKMIDNLEGYEDIPPYIEMSDFSIEGEFDLPTLDNLLDTDFFNNDTAICDF